MAIYRQIQTTFWSDTFVENLTPDQKYFYIYLLTNEKTKQCGIYEISLKTMSFETGFPKEAVEKHLQFFEKSHKIKWSKETSEIALKNWAKYNSHTSPKVKVCIDKELKLVKNTLLIQYVYSIDSISQEEETQTQTEEETEEEEIIDFKSQKNLILDQIYSFEDFWKQYPVKVGKSKCEALFNKLKSEQRQKIKDTIKSFIQHKPFKDYNLPHPQTYLNQKRWDDELPLTPKVKIYEPDHIPSYQDFIE